MVVHFRSPSLIFLSLLFCLSLGRCAPSQPTQPTGTLRWALDSITDLPTLDPAQADDQKSSAAINQIFAGLVRRDENARIQLDGAERWSVSKDGRTYTFTIRNGLKFSDGTPVTAQDFAYSINRSLAPEFASFGAPAQLGHILGAQEVIEKKAKTAKGIQVIDERTLQIELDEPRAYFLSQLAYVYTFVVPPKLIAEKGKNWQEYAVGTGPFRLKKWSHKKELVLESNPYYWRGIPKVANVRLIFFKTIEEAYQSYQRNEVDIIGDGESNVPAKYLAKLKNSPDLKVAPALTVWYVGFNNQHSPFDNVQVRQALALATDKRLLSQSLPADTIIPTDRILPKGLGGSEKLVEGQAFNPSAAQAALRLAGYFGGQDLPEITLTYGKTGEVPLVAETLKKTWEDSLGVKVKLAELSLENFIKQMDLTYQKPKSAQALQLYISVWGADYPDPQNFLSQQLHSKSPNNNGHWSDKEFDRLVEQADQMGEQQKADERFDLYQKAERIALEKVGWLPLYNPRTSILVRPTVKGLVLNPSGLTAPNWAEVRVEAQ